MSFFRSGIFAALCWNIAALGIILSGCANIQPLGGGSPDKTPPFIVNFSPAMATTKFSGDMVSLEFSEYVDKSKALENISITPAIKFESSWSGHSLDIIFQEQLLPNSTYSFLLGTEYSDLKGNKPENAFSLIFSTGEIIDSGVVKGKVFGDVQSGVYVFLYPLSSDGVDTLDPRTTPPKYLTQCGSSGEFAIHALPDGDYRLIAVKDEAKDKLYSEGSDMAGTPWKSVRVNNAQSEFIPLKLGAAVDRTPPRFLYAETVAKDMIRLEWSEELDSLAYSPKYISVSDSAGGGAVPVRSVSRSFERPKNIIVKMEQPLDTAVRWKVSAEASVSDRFGNSVVDSVRSQYCYGSTTPDSLLPKLLSTPFADSSLNIALSPTFEFFWNRAVNISLPDSAFQLTSSLGVVPMKSDVLFGNGVRLKPMQLLSNYSWHILKILPQYILDDNGNPVSDTVSLRFRTTDTREYGTLRGVVLDDFAASKNGYILILKQRNVKKTPQPIQRRIFNKDSWEVAELPPGEYSVELFADDNGDGKYDSGSPFPYKSSERFSIIAQTVQVRPRWVVEGIKLRME